MSVSQADKQLLIDAIDAFIADDNLNEITFGLGVQANRSQSGQGIELANLFRGQQLICFQEFKQGKDTISDKDPNWKQGILESDL